MSSLDEDNEEISQIKEEIKRSRERETDFRQKILSYEDGAESEDKGKFSVVIQNMFGVTCDISHAVGSIFIPAF